MWLKRHFCAQFTAIHQQAAHGWRFQKQAAESTKVRIWRSRGRILRAHHYVLFYGMKGLNGVRSTRKHAGVDHYIAQTCVYARNMIASETAVHSTLDEGLRVPAAAVVATYASPRLFSITIDLK